MNILVLSSECWNDKVNGNNVTSNWFDGMNAKFANIYCSPGEPFNNCCNKYFQITDVMMAKSILTSTKAGKKVTYHVNSNHKITDAEKEPKKLYSFLKCLSGDFLRLTRELIWLWGRYDISRIKSFIDDFKPDIIFSERMASVKMLRLEKIVSSLTTAPLIAFTGDDEYSLKQLNMSPFFWINRFMVRARLRKMINKYKIYYCLSYEQMMYYKKRFADSSCKMKVLKKCGTFENAYSHRAVHNPIRIIYAGKFYMKRWKVLSEIADVLRDINKDGVKAVLEIYTGDIPNKIQAKLLNDRKNTFIMGRVSQEKLSEIYGESDIALHVESRETKYALQTRLSFSTKIIDCIFSGCAILAYCRNDQSGWLYLKREDAAICVSNYKELKSELNKMCSKHEIIRDYARRAYECGIKNHNKNNVQKNLILDFESVINA